MTKQPNWTQHEVRTVTRAYQQGGIAAAIKACPRRTPVAIRNKVLRLMIPAGVPEGYVEAIHVHPTGVGNKASDFLLNAARQDGVLIHNPSTWIKYLVPIDWAEQYMQAMDQHLQDYETHKHWITASQLAKLLGYSRSYIPRAFRRNERLAQEINAAIEWKHLIYPRDQMYFHPTQARDFARRYTARMQCPKCKHLKTRVIRTKDEHIEVTRRRRCTNCHHRFNTTEMPTKELTQQRLNP